MFENEYTRASISTVTTEIFKLLTSYLFVKNTPNKSPTSSVVIYIVAALLHYTLDIFVAKTFKPSQNKLKWYGNSFLKHNFSKYMVVAILHLLISQHILNYINITLNHEISSKPTFLQRYRNTFILFLINIVSFALYGYFLKFKWAYVDESEPLLTMIVLSWCTLSIMIYTLSNKKC